MVHAAVAQWAATPPSSGRALRARRRLGCGILLNVKGFPALGWGDTDCPSGGARLK